MWAVSSGFSLNNFKVTVKLPYTESFVIIYFDTLLIMFFNFETAMAYNIAISYPCKTKIESLTFTIKSSSKLLP